MSLPCDSGAVIVPNSYPIVAPSSRSERRTHPNAVAASQPLTELPALGVPYHGAHDCSYDCANDGSGVCSNSGALTAITGSYDCSDTKGGCNCHCCDKHARSVSSCLDIVAIR